MGRHLSPRYGQVILVSGYPVLTAVNWSQHWCTLCVQYQSSCAPKLARKWEIKHWFPCCADGRAGGRCTVTWLPNFLGWVDLLTHGAPQARFTRQSSAINKDSITPANPQQIVIRGADRKQPKSIFYIQGRKTFCASFRASLIAGSRRAFLCVDCVSNCLLLEFWVKCTRCER